MLWFQPAHRKQISKTIDVMVLSEELIFNCIDIANGYSEHLVEYVQRVRAEFPDKVISAGNVVTGDMVEELILAGADIVKVGIGPGSVCTTRVKPVSVTHNCPRLSNVRMLRTSLGRIIGDRGCTCPGDVAKAFGGKADLVKIGGMLAGHEDSGGELIVKMAKPS